MIRTLALVCYLFSMLVLVMPWLILWSLITGRPDLMYSITMKLVRSSLPIAGIRVRVEGSENIPPGVCIFAANHVSNVDPLAFVPSIPRRVSIIAKETIFRIPILSKAMRLAKFIPVDRTDREAAAESVELAVQCLKEGLSFAIYPEGTRSRDGRLLPFKKGAFVMAIQAGVPVVPVSIVGAQSLMRKGEWIIRPGGVSIRFGPAVDAAAYTIDRRSELLARVEALVAAGLPEDQRPLPSTSA
jgi:1-acyl-sn-glycerol-3-phosphate acyltransferase